MSVGHLAAILRPMDRSMLHTPPADFNSEPGLNSTLAGRAGRGMGRGAGPEGCCGELRCWSANQRRPEARCRHRRRRVPVCVTLLRRSGTDERRQHRGYRRDQLHPQANCSFTPWWSV